MMIPIITPKRPKAEAKICTINIDTKVEGVCACERAVPVPMQPTDSPHTKLERPTTPPIANTLNAEYSAYWKAAPSVAPVVLVRIGPSLFCRIMAIITP